MLTARKRLQKGGAHISPDGEWLVYQSNQSGRWEVWLRRYPSGARQQVSQGGGVRPLWQPVGARIVFQRGADLFAAAIRATGAGAPVRLFGLEPNDMLLDVTADGRFIVRRATAPPPPTALRLVANWFGHVRRVAAGRGR